MKISPVQLLANTLIGKTITVYVNKIYGNRSYALNRGDSCVEVHKRVIKDIELISGYMGDELEIELTFTDTILGGEKIYFSPYTEIEIE